jgi:hypothetical protein
MIVIGPLNHHPGTELLKQVANRTQLHSSMRKVSRDSGFSIRKAGYNNLGLAPLACPHIDNADRVVDHVSPRRDCRMSGRALTQADPLLSWNLNACSDSLAQTIDEN